jgi:hypothetical protein
VSSSANGTLLECVFGSVLESFLRARLESTLKQAGNVPSSAIGRVLECLPESVLENVLAVYLTVS